MPDVKQALNLDDDNHIRLVSALTTMSDENALFSTYPAAGSNKLRDVARAQSCQMSTKSCAGTTPMCF